MWCFILLDLVQNRLEEMARIAEFMSRFDWLSLV